MSTSEQNELDSMRHQIRMNLGRCINEALAPDAIEPPNAAMLRIAMQWIESSTSKPDDAKNGSIAAAIESLRQSRAEGADLPPLDLDGDDDATS